MWRLRSSLRGYYLRAIAPQFLAAVHRFCVVAKRALVCPGPARLDISLLTAWRLALGPCFLVRAPTIRRLPMGCHGWGSCMFPHFDMLSVLFPGNIGFDFFRISRSFFIHQPLWLLILNGSQVSHTRSPSLLRLNLLLILKVSTLLEQMKFCFSQDTFFLILTKE